MRYVTAILASLIVSLTCPIFAQSQWDGNPDSEPNGVRLRVIVETDAGGDPDDEQSLVRFLLYANEWDIEGIICNRPRARDGENRNSARTGLAIVQRLVTAYGECYPNLVQHDARYPKPDTLMSRTVAGYEDRDDGVDLILAAAEADDPRPIWFMNWGTDHGSGSSSLKRALDRVFTEKGPAAYAKFKSRFRLSSGEAFGDHTTKIEPPFELWVDTFRPEIRGKRWYHRFSALTATAGSFDLDRDVLNGHGPLGSLYPANTTHRQKEGDTMTFLYLVPTGMNYPEQPTWGSWAGRYGRNPDFDNESYYFANQVDRWQDSADRDNTLKRWAIHLQHDFKARLDWCVSDFSNANHPPVPRLKGDVQQFVKCGEMVVVDASDSTDPDEKGEDLKYEWLFYPEVGSYHGKMPELSDATSARTSFIAPEVSQQQTLHLILIVTDNGSPKLTRYCRKVLNISSK